MPGAQERGQRSVLPPLYRHETNQCIQATVENYKLQENNVMKVTLLRSQDYATQMTQCGNTEIHTISDWTRCQSESCQDHYWTVRAV
jgi:hypothetical protein